MAKITMLGTGNGGTLDIYNTCFVIQNDNGSFLVDTGGSIEVAKRIRDLGIELYSIKDIFISHSHSDHILGLIWYFRYFLFATHDGDGIDSKVNIYCNSDVYKSINTIMDCVFDKFIIDLVNKNFNFVVLNDGDKYSIDGVEYTFFDIKAKRFLQYGFEGIIDGKKLVFLGDETLNPLLYDRVSNSDYVMHEACCLDSEEHIFHGRAYGHGTVKDVAKVMNNLNVKNLILYHTEESHSNRKELYTNEAKSIFKGNVFVPDDLEAIEL